MIQYLEWFFQYALGLQLIFWGLNGLFRWKAPPPSDPRLDAFVMACEQTGFIMPTVKYLEILIGILLIGNFAVPLALVLFSPLIFVISGLHLAFNKKPWGVLGLYTLPYVALVIFRWEQLLRLVH